MSIRGMRLALAEAKQWDTEANGYEYMDEADRWSDA